MVSLVRFPWRLKLSRSANHESEVEVTRPASVHTMRSPATTHFTYHYQGRSVVSRMVCASIQCNGRLPKLPPRFACRRMRRTLRVERIADVNRMLYVILGMPATVQSIVEIFHGSLRLVSTVLARCLGCVIGKQTFHHRNITLATTNQIDRPHRAFPARAVRHFEMS